MIQKLSTFSGTILGTIFSNPYFIHEESKVQWYKLLT